MAVVETTISSALQVLYASAKTTPMTEADFADEMAKIIADAIKSGDVNAGTFVDAESRPITGTGTIS